MAPKRCTNCGGVGGAHFAFCFGARLFERVMGKGFPLFPPGAFTHLPVRTTIKWEDVKAQRAVQDAGAEAYRSLQPDTSAEMTHELQEQAARIEELREALEHERDARVAQREATERLARERDDLRALLEAATAPEEAVAEAGPAPDPEPWWWNSPEGREARVSVALDGETQSIGDPLPTLEQLAEVPDEPAEPDEPAGPLDEAEVEALEEAVAELEERQDPAEIAEVDAAVEAAEQSMQAAERRRTLMDEQRARVKEMIANTEGLTQKALSEAIGLNGGTLSSILSGKAYGPVAATHLQRMLEAAANFSPTPARQPEAAIRNASGWAAVELFLEEMAERVEGDFTSAPETQAAYEEFRKVHELPPVKPTTVGQVVVSAGFTRLRRHINGAQVRGYGGLRLKSRDGGEASQDGEPAARERLHPDAERYTRDETAELLGKLHESGRSVAGTLTTYIASERPFGGLATAGAGDPGQFLARTAPQVPVIEHPTGWEELPGRELKNTEIRAMAILLRKEQGWGYKKSAGGNGRPKLRSPQGRVFALSATPEDWRSVKNTRAQLRRLGADL